MKPEIHLFIIWEYARDHQASILEDIEKSFTVLACYEMHWSQKHFADNLTRFYGTSLPKGSYKELHVGVGPFLLVIVEDHAPDYDYHETSKGKAHVNSRIFGAKSRYRELTGGGHKIHATNDPHEVDHDLTLLLGVNAEDFKKSHRKHSSTAQVLKRDLEGAEGWQDLPQFFYVLNNTVKYVVMRNYAPLPNNYYLDKHGDIDLLVDDLEQFLFIAGGRKVYPEAHRVHYALTIGKKEVLFDFRFVGDNYYDQRWQKHIIAHRQPLRGFYVPAADDYFFSLLYHAYVHKPHVAQDYIDEFIATYPTIASKGLPLVDSDGFNDRAALMKLKKFLQTYDYSIVRPDDSSVYFNEATVARLKTRIIYGYAFHRSKSYLRRYKRKLTK